MTRRRHASRAVVVLAALALVLDGAAPVHDARRAIARLLSTAPSVADHVDDALAPLDPDARRFVATRIEQRLRDLAQSDVTLPPEALRRTVVDFEAWKHSTYLAAGIAPKRYFGYLDRQGDTAADERRLRDVIKAAVAMADARPGTHARVSDIEVAVTWLAEGGALVLGPRQHLKDDLPPVAGLGLDDLASGCAAEADLVRRLDARFGTSLADFIGERPSRNLDFVEGLLAVTVMYAWEKDLVAGALAARGEALASLPLDEQFIVTSLRYNAGIVFGRERVNAIRDFATADYLVELSRASARRRPPLPVRSPGDAEAELLAAGDYPVQATTWSAVANVLQRWGAFAALRRFTDDFDDQGSFR